MDLAGLTLGPPAAHEQLEKLERALGHKLPNDLYVFLSKHDGATGTLGPRQRPFTLWSVETIGKESEQQEIALAVKGLILFGTDGGAEGYGYLGRLQRGRYGRISLLAAGAHEFESLGETLEELLASIAQS